MNVAALLEDGVEVRRVCQAQGPRARACSYVCWRVGGPCDEVELPVDRSPETVAAWLEA